MNRDEALARTDLGALLDEIGGRRGLSSRGRRWPCPFQDHAQTGASPPVGIERQGVYDVWHCPVCEKGGSAVDALVAAGDTLPDALRRLGIEEERVREDWTVEAEYIYHDAAGAEVFKVVRFTGKRFRQQRRDGAGWAWGMEGVTRQLFKLPEVLEAKKAGRWIFLTEGEKDALAVRNAGYCATTMPGGAGKWERQYTEALTGANVIVLGDDDEVGQQHAAHVWRELHGRAARVAPRLPASGHKDIAEHLAAGLPLDREHLRPLPLTDLTPAVNGTRRGTLTARAFAARPGSDRTLEVLGPMFQRGMRTVVGAHTGEGKSSFALQAVHALTTGEPFLGWQPLRPGRALVVDLEQGEETLKARLSESGLNDSDRVDILWEPSGIALDRREEDRAMVRDVLRDGQYDMVVLDPLYQAHRGGSNDEEVAATTMRYVDEWAREFHLAWLIPMHARKPHPDAGRNFTIHDIAGVSTWLRNAEFVLGLQLMFAGESRLWFFKDRIGRGPEIRTHWLLDFDRAREALFARNHRREAEEEAAKERRRRREQRKALKREMVALLQRDEGATEAELREVADDDDLVAAALTKGHHQNGDRYRTRMWHARERAAQRWAVHPEQTTLGDGTG